MLDKLIGRTVDALYCKGCNSFKVMKIGTNEMYCQCCATLLQTSTIKIGIGTMIIGGKMMSENENIQENSEFTLGLRALNQIATRLINKSVDKQSFNKLLRILKERIPELKEDMEKLRLK